MSTTIEIECPYCGNKIFVCMGPRTREINGKILIASAKTINELTIYSSIEVTCSFCGKRYTWYNISSRDLVSMMEYSNSFLEWLKRYEIDLSKLESYVFAIVEPKKGVFSNLRKTLKRRWGKIPFKLVEIFLKVERDGHIYRASIPGKFFMTPPFHIDLSPGVWITGPPPERKISNNCEVIGR